MFVNIQTAIAEAHGEFHFDRYSKDWLVKMSTNCMAFALGLETASNSELYRVGALCGKKPIDQEYFSEYEVKELFLEDLQVLKLNVKQVTFEEIKVMELESNQYIVFLFVTKYGKEIGDFHFWRYDNEWGFTQKRPRQVQIIIENPKRDWPENWNTKLMGAFVITK